MPGATNSDKYSPISILTGVVGPIGTFYPTRHNGNTDGNGPKWPDVPVARAASPDVSTRAISILYWDFNPIFQTFQSNISDISIRSPAHNTIWWNRTPTDMVAIVIITNQLPNCRYLVNAHQVDGWLTMARRPGGIRRAGD